MDINNLDEKSKENLRWYLEYLVNGGLSDEQIEFFVHAEYVPNSSQLEFHRNCNLCKEGGVKELLIEGPKGGGKSHATLMQAAFDCMKYPGIICLFFRKQKTGGHGFGLASDTGFNDWLDQAVVFWNRQFL